MSITEKVDEVWLMHHKYKKRKLELLGLLNKMGLQRTGYKYRDLIPRGSWIQRFLEPILHRKVVESFVIVSSDQNKTRITVINKQQLENARYIANKLTNHGFKCTIVKQFIEE